MSDKVKGHDFDTEERTGTPAGEIADEETEISGQELDQVAGGVRLSDLNWINSNPIQFRPAFTNPILSTWGRRGPVSDSAFKLTIPGPSFVQVQSGGQHDASEVPTTEAPTASAVEIFEDLNRE